MNWDRIESRQTTLAIIESKQDLIELLIELSPDTPPVGRCARLLARLERDAVRARRHLEILEAQDAR